jgi:prepilin-type N-terminal cleavage/methylation domain-containing protein
MSQHKMRGFSLVEMMIVVAIIMITIGTALLQIGPIVKESKAQAALQTTLGQMRRAHELAIDQRQVYRVSFTAPRTIQLDQVAIDPVTKAKILTFRSRIDLPLETQFTVVTGMPSTPTTVPEGFGNGAVAIDFDQDFGGGGTEVYFQRDGTALDGTNRANNGVIYMCRPGELTSCKAVSLMGATGRSKGWRLTQTGGVAKWIQ